MGIRYGDTTYRVVSWSERERDFWLACAGFEQGALVIHEDQCRRLRVAVRVNTGGEDVRGARIQVALVMKILGGSGR